MLSYHCNKCYRLKELELTTLELFMSQCGHILCSNCVQSVCVICAQPFRPSTPISELKGTALAAYFENPLQKYRHLQKVLKFQLKQQANLFHYFVNVMPAERSLIRNQLKGYDKLDVRLTASEENERMRIMKLKEYLSYTARQPSTTTSNSSDGQKSVMSFGTHKNVRPTPRTYPSTPTLSSICSDKQTAKSASHTRAKQKRHTTQFKSDVSLLD